MSLLVPTSLADTLDDVSDALFWGRKLTRTHRDEVAKWLAARQGLPGSYADTFAPPEDYRDQRLALFTGERRPSRAGARLVLGNETCRVLTLLEVPARPVREALARAEAGMVARLGPLATGPGTYRCTSCTPAVWRNLSAARPDGSEPFLSAGVRHLRTLRLGDGKWRSYPFWYTLLALSEMRTEEAAAELRYAAPVCEALLGRRPRDGVYEERRRELARRVVGG